MGKSHDASARSHKDTLTVTKATTTSTSTSTTSTNNIGSVGNSSNYPGTSPFLTPTSNTTVSINTAYVPVVPSTNNYKTGNAFFSIPNATGGNIWQGEVWITSFYTGSYTQFEQEQVHRGMNWFPIRRSEMFIQFTIDWPYQSTTTLSGFNDMQNFQDSLRLHQQQSALNTGTPVPITFVYYNGNGTNSNKSNITASGSLMWNGNNSTLLEQAGSKTQPYSLKPLEYQGWVETVEKEYARFKSVFRRSYRMAVINSAGTQVSELQTTSQYSSLVPNQLSSQTYGFGWINNNIAKGSSIPINKITG